jgi:hypothetical protein
MMRQIGRRGLSAASAFEPEDDGGENEHGAIIERALLIASRQSTPLFEAIDTALHDIATGIDRLVEEERPPRSSGSLRALVASLGNGVLDLPLTQPAPTAGVAVALIGDEAVWAGPWSSTSGGAWDPDAVQDRSQLRTVLALSWRNHDGAWSSAPVTGEMEFARQPSAAAPESLVGGGRDPCFSSA